MSEEKERPAKPDPPLVPWKFVPMKIQRTHKKIMQEGDQLDAFEDR